MISYFRMQANKAVAKNGSVMGGSIMIGNGTQVYTVITKHFNLNMQLFGNRLFTTVPM